MDNSFEYGLLYTIFIGKELYDCSFGKLGHILYRKDVLREVCRNMFLEGGTDSKEELQKLYDRRSITDNENIIIEATTIYEVDKTCMNQIKRCNCMHTSNIVWEMERMMEVYGCDVVLVDQIEL